MMEKRPKIKIFVAHHKPGYIYEDDVYVPIQVGKKNSKIDLGILGDDTGDNISEKNDNYAELTAQYWVWKNYDLSDVDYVGFCHYRRYMTYCYKPNIFNYIFAKNFYSPLEEFSGFLRWRFISYKSHNCLFKFNKKLVRINSQNMIQYIQNNNYDVFMPKKIPYIGPLILKSLGIKVYGNKEKTSFGNFGDKNEFFYECINLFFKKYPEQKLIFSQIEEQDKFEEGYRRHLFIMRKNLYFQYMEWLFDYLFELEKLIEKKHLDVKMHWAGEKDGRFVGIFSEPLINYRLMYMEKEKGVTILSKANTLMFTSYYL